MAENEGSTLPGMTVEQTKKYVNFEEPLCDLLDGLQALNALSKDNDGTFAVAVRQMTAGMLTNVRMLLAAVDADDVSRKADGITISDRSFTGLSLELERCRSLASVICRELGEENISRERFSLVDQLLDRISKAEKTFDGFADSSAPEAANA